MSEWCDCSSGCVVFKPKEQRCRRIEDRRLFLIEGGSLDDFDWHGWSKDNRGHRTVSAYDKFLAEIRAMQASLDRMADLLTLIAPAPSPVTVWSCGHGHVTRDEAIACLQEQRRAAALSAAAQQHLPG